jgi:hypothetical protein
MDIREIREMVMRTASRVEEAERKLATALLEMPPEDDAPCLVIGSIPAFWREFLISVRDGNIRELIGKFGIFDNDFHDSKVPFHGISTHRWARQIRRATEAERLDYSSSSNPVFKFAFCSICTNVLPDQC